MAKSKRDEYLGKVYVNNQGLKITIVEYNNSKDVTVQFEDGATRKTSISDIKVGSIKHPRCSNKSGEYYLGKTYINNQGLKMKVVNYENSKNITVQFEDGATRSTSVDCALKGWVPHPNDMVQRINKREEYLGKIYINNQGLKMKVIEYTDARNIMVQFSDGYIKKSSVQHLLIGQIKNPYYTGVKGVGYVGEGKYKSKINGKMTVEYTVWFSMLTRCYDKKWQEKHRTYIGCTMAKEWHNFQNFAEWYNNEWYDIGEKLDVDKDFKVKGNKIYCAENCLIIPSRINRMVRHYKVEKYKNPIGVRNSNTRFEATIGRWVNGAVKIKYIGAYDTPEQAFQAYKQAKEAYIQQVANEYKQKYGDKFPDKVYQALMNYRVEITD